MEPVAGLEPKLLILAGLRSQPDSFRLKKLQQFTLLFLDNKEFSARFNYYPLFAHFSFSVLSPLDSSELVPVRICGCFHETR